MSLDITKDSLKNHYAFTEADFMKSFTTKLKPYGFQHFSYIRILDQNQRILLTTDPAYSEVSIQEEFHKFAFFGPAELYTDGLFLTDALNLGEIRPALEFHGISAGFILMRKHLNYVEHFAFCSNKKDPLLNNFIINNLDLFEQTIQEFQDKSKSLIKKYEKSLLIYPSSTDITGLSNLNWPCVNKMSQLSTRECEIFYHLRQGLSSKRIALSLHLSPRTVEKHIENMFLKTNCKSRFELMEKIRPKGLL